MKNFVRIEADRVRVFKLKKGPRQMVTINSRLYRIDDEFMLSDKFTGDAMIFYNIDSTQPIMHRATFIDPDMTRAYIDYAKIGKSRKRIWQNIDGKTIYKMIVPISIAAGLIYGFITGAI